MSASVEIHRLYHLPRELRDHIFELVFLAETEAPELPSDQDTRREEYQRWGSVYYERDLPLPNLQGLLGCNRQSRQEALETINRCNTSDGSALHYKLDLAVWGCSLQPTWVFLPVPPKYVKQVTVNFRMFSHSMRQWGSHSRKEVDDGYGILTQYLLQMLRRFLHHGPSFATNPPGRRNIRPLYPLHIDRLQIDFANMTTEIVDVDGIKTFATLPPAWTESWHGPEKHAFMKLSSNAKKIARIGILHGSIDEVRVRYRHLAKGWQVPDSRDKALAAKVLSPYGWGPILRITQKSVDAGDIAYSEALDCKPPPSDDEVAEMSRELEEMFLTNYEEYGRGWKSHW